MRVQISRDSQKCILDATTRLSVLLFLLLLLFGRSFAQGTTATISGEVTDEKGGLLPGAQVTARNINTNATRTASTEESGRYLIPELALGEYEVGIEKSAFSRELRRGIILTVGRDAVVNFSLKVGSVQEQVVITEDASLVNTTTSEISALVNERTITELPLNGRDLFQLATLQIGVISVPSTLTDPSVESGPGAQKLSINGGRIDFNNFMLDGTSVNEAQNTTPGSAAGGFTGVDAIQEFQILTNNYSAEYGGAGGGIINLVSKSGTNSFHGTLFEFHRNSVFDARNFFDPGEIPSFKRNQFGGSVGGPIRKDRTFIFGAYEGLREGLGVSRPFIVPTDEVRAGSLTLTNPNGTTRTITVSPAVRPYIDLYPRPNVPGGTGGQGTFIRGANRQTDGDFFMIRADHKITDQDNFFARYNFDDGEVLDPNGVITDSFLATRNQYAGLEETHIFSPNVVNTLRFSYNRSFIEGDDIDIIQIPQSLIFVPGAPTLGFFRGIEISALSTRALVPRFLVVNNFELSDHLTYNRGAHSMKFGATVRRTQFNAVSTNVTFGGYIFAASSTATAYENFLRARPQVFAAPLTGSDAYRGIRTTHFAVYGQDDWRVRRNLTLNLGLRYEVVTSPTEVHDRYANIRSLSDTGSTTGYPFFVTPKTNFAPRIGFAWDLFGDGKTSLRGGYGIFYVEPTPNLYRFQMSTNPPYFTVGVAFIPPVPFPNGFGSLVPLAALVGFSAIEFEPPPAYVQQWNLGLQRELFGGVTATVAYVGSRGVHLPANANRNTAQNFTILPNGEKQFPAPPARNPPRNPALGPTRVIYFNADSYYNGLQVNLERRFAHGLQFQMAYTFSKSIDTASDAVGNYAFSAHDLPQDPENLRGERGLSVFDRRHVFNLSTLYQLPYKTDPDASGARRVADFLLGGWQLNNIISYQSGSPFNPIISQSNSNNGNQDNNERPDWVAGFNPDNAVTGNVNQYFNPAAFRRAPAGQFGDVGRNVLIGPNVFTVDLSFMKENKITERMNLQFRAEAFNLFNRANFALPTVFDSESPSAGRITRTVTPSRQLQFGVKLIF
ncbi:hypothetical protein BH18ACI4_BH18ACI4_00370 [soil metagenome]